LGVTEKEVQAQLARILASGVFLSSELLSRFLAFVVEQTLGGRKDWLKESVLGTEIFGRGQSFDPRTDPVVRVDARRLRTKLTEYYQEEGRFDPVLITLPKGGYVPVFAENDRRDAAPRPAPPDRSLAVLPFVNVGDGFDSFSDGLTEEIIAAMVRIPGLHVAARSAVFCYRAQAQDIRKVGEALNVRLIVEGNIRRAGNRLRMGAQLIDAASGFHRWSEMWERDPGDVFALQQEIAVAIAERVALSLNA
jgi:adenylate cyclase